MTPYMPVSTMLPMPNTQEPTKFNYGGQAVIEGVMMRGSKALAVAARNPEGEIVIHTEPLNTHIYGGRIAKIPFLRGLTLLWDALGLGIKSLMFSAEVALEEEDGKSAEGDTSPDKIFEGPVQWGIVLFSLSFSILLFFVLPTVLADRLMWLFKLGESQLIENLFEGMIRLALLIGYVWGIGFMADIKRLYGYHGAEHKTINAFEAGAELTPESVSTFSLEHPRCGTAFLLTVVIISILMYSLLPDMSLLIRIISRIAFLPIVAGIAYEFLRFTAANQDKAVIRFITKPNLALQHLTTEEPDMDMIAVAIAAFKQVLAFEQSEEEADKPVGDSIAATPPVIGEPAV